MDENLKEIEITKIEYEAKNNPIFKIVGLRVFSNPNPDFRDIVTISEKGLILIRGNSKTGYKHIRERHDFWTIKNYIVGNRFQAQSKFSPEIFPIDYIKIANEIYSKENLIVNNDHIEADQFEKYVGKCNFDGEKEDVNLLLYKNTKIIHSLFPQNKKHNKNRNRTKYPYVRGKVAVEVNYRNEVTEIYVPFLNHDFEEKYILFIERFYDKELEDRYIFILDNEGKLIDVNCFGSKKLTFFKGGKYAKTTFQHCDLRIIEDYLLEIDNLNKNK